MKFSLKNNHCRLFYLWLLFLLVSFFTFGRILDNFFASDDFHWLTIARDTVWHFKIFITNYEGTNLGGSYNPLLVVIFKIFYSLWNTNYFGYHLISIIIHSSNALLVYILTKKIFNISGIVRQDTLAIVTAVLFLLYPVHVETISWIAAWPHLWVSLFYLLSLIYYFDFREKNNKNKLVYSLIFFILALFVKEIAISLPLVIVLWEIYLVSLKKFSQIRSYYLLIYFGILAVFLYLRYLSTGLIFGYYGSSSISFSLVNLAGNVLPFFGEFVSFGFLRGILYRGVYKYTDLVAIVVMSGLALYFFILLKKKRYIQFVSIVSLLLILAPMLAVGMHRTTWAGERYLYLASVFFIIWFIFVLQNFSWSSKMVKYGSILFVIFSISLIGYKLSIWNSASDLSRQIVASYKNLDLDKGQALLTVALPDNLDGAEVFRNNLGQALEIYYPNNYPQVLATQAYLQLSQENKNSHLLQWRHDDRGWFGESTDGGFVVTGITSISAYGVYWELWNYNYQNYLANIIRLIPNYYTMEKISNGELKILIFDGGVLSILQ